MPHTLHRETDMIEDHDAKYWEKHHETELRVNGLERDVQTLQRDTSNHRVTMNRLLDSLEAIRLEISGAKGFLKALTVGGTIAVIIITALFTIHWIQVPSINVEQPSKTNSDRVVTQIWKVNGTHNIRTL